MLVSNVERVSVSDLTSRYADSQSKSTIVNIASAEETRTAIDWFAEDDAEEKRYG